MTSSRSSHLTRSNVSRCVAGRHRVDHRFEGLLDRPLAGKYQNSRTYPIIRTLSTTLTPNPVSFSPRGAPGVPVPPSAPVFGSLLVKVVRGIDLKAGQTMFGKADPYAKVTIGTQSFSTKPVIGGGKNPVWDAELSFEIKTEKELTLEVFSKEQVGNDKFMGATTVSVLDWIATGHFDGDIDINDKSDKPVGP